MIKRGGNKWLGAMQERNEESLDEEASVVGMERKISSDWKEGIVVVTAKKKKVVEWQRFLLQKEFKAVVFCYLRMKFTSKCF